MPSDRFDILADELILEILDHLWRSPITTESYKYRRSISQCNSRLRRIALPTFYRTVSIPDTRSLRLFLRNVIESPIYSDLVRVLEVDWYQSESVDQYSRNITCIEEARTLTRELVPRVDEEDPKVNLAHLLHLLKHLEVVDIKAGHRYDRGILPYLAGFLSQQHSSNLQRFEWRKGDLPLEALVPALLIPSLRKLCMFSAFASESFDHQWFPDLPRGTDLASWYGKSNVEELCLRKSDIRVQDLAQILQLPRALKILQCEGQFSTPLNDVGVRLQTALEHVSQSLEFLCLFWTPESWYSGSLPSFHNLTSLTFLVLEHPVLFDHRRESVIECLPPSLKVLFSYSPGDIVDEPPLDHLLPGWERLLKATSPRLPKLRMIGHQPKTTLLLPLLDLAKKRKVQIARRFLDYLNLKESYMSDIRKRYPHVPSAPSAN
ncbi:hypothetical protein CPB86DRAFT_789401 [Serendipita vermifera]|nr:hypothetical protein CPB86DRAFT_789401 [Serendipita vermifera]